MRRLRYDRVLYRERHLIERAMGHVGRAYACPENRRVGSRHEKRAMRYRATVQVTRIERYLRGLESPDRTYSSSVYGTVEP